MLNKKPPVGFAVSTDQSENKRKQIDKYLDLARELRKIKVTMISVVVVVLKMVPKEELETENQRKNQDLPNYSIAEINQNLV